MVNCDPCCKFIALGAQKLGCAWLATGMMVWHADVLLWVVPHGSLTQATLGMSFHNVYVG